MAQEGDHGWKHCSVFKSSNVKYEKESTQKTEQGNQVGLRPRLSRNLRQLIWNILSLFPAHPGLLNTSKQSIIKLLSFRGVEFLIPIAVPVYFCTCKKSKL